MKDYEKYPVYVLHNGILRRLKTLTDWDSWEMQLHHYIPQQRIRQNPDKFKEIEHLQKLFFLPRLCHMELHAGTRNFKEKWGIERKELIYNLREK